jgi:hypothetical protein
MSQEADEERSKASEASEGEASDQEVDTLKSEPSDPVKPASCMKNVKHKDLDRGGTSSFRDSETVITEVWPDWKGRKARDKKAKNRRREALTSMIKPSASKANLLFPQTITRSWTKNISKTKKLSMGMDSGDGLPKDGTSLDSQLGFMISPPSSIARLTWDLCCLEALLWDLIVIPFQAFEPEPNAFLIVMAWLTSLFWTFDMPMTFFSGYHCKGYIEMRFSKISKRYFRGWFSFDIIVLLTDWMTIIGSLAAGGLGGGEESGSSMAGEETTYVRLAKSARFLRMARLLRLLKVRGKVADIMDHMQSESFKIVLGVAGMLLVILVSNHTIACGWWYVGTTAPNGEDDPWSWVNHFNMRERGLFYQYTTALHWSMTQFTPASMEIVPRNAY